MTEHAPILIYKASAGSGKTFQLTYPYIHFLFEAHVRRAHMRIFAVTFTNKATAEMKSRILKELHALSQGGQPLYREWLRRDFPELSSEQITERARQFLTELLFDYSGFRVHTIDGFFQQLVRAFSREIGLQGSYQVALDSKVALENGVDNLLNGLEKLEHARLLSWLTEFVEERLENAEYWQPRNNIIELGNEIFKEAYANHAKELEEKVNDKDFLRHYRDALRAQITVFEDKVKALCEDAMRMLSASGLEVADFKCGQKSFVIHLDYEYLKKKGYVLTATFINSAAMWIVGLQRPQNARMR